MNKIKFRFGNLSIRLKLILSVVCTSVILLAVNLFLYRNINGTIDKVEEVYATNTGLNELTDILGKVQQNMFAYLNTKSSAALEDYFRYDQEYRALCEELNNSITDNPVKMMERTIRELSDSYLDIAAQTIQAKRGRNIEKYMLSYEKATQVYNYINSYVYSLNQEQFRYNSDNYEVFISSLKYLEIISSIVLIVITVLNVFLLIFLTGNITKPLSDLVGAANEIAEGNFNVELPAMESMDEVGIVTSAFNTMVLSIHDYIVRLRESMETESRMKEKELKMESHLKDAQLKYLQAQINPHFLFNTLNAGAQLAMMENAEKTCLFVENMAEFFRYNVQKMNQDATLEEEVHVVDNYIYILNVRFSGEIHFEKRIDPLLSSVRIPSMVLQPIVENAVQYGIRDIEWEGKIILSVYQQGRQIYISIADNGRGMTEEKIAAILKGELAETDNGRNSTGIGLSNVINRLRLYYNRQEVMQIRSPGRDLGTEVIILAQLKEQDG